jgi:hypothetical protein
MRAACTCKRVRGRASTRVRFVHLFEHAGVIACERARARARQYVRAPNRLPTDYAAAFAWQSPVGLVLRTCLRWHAHQAHSVESLRVRSRARVPACKHELLPCKSARASFRACASASEVCARAPTAPQPTAVAFACSWFLPHSSARSCARTAPAHACSAPEREVCARLGQSACARTQARVHASTREYAAVTVLRRCPRISLQTAAIFFV